MSNQELLDVPNSTGDRSKPKVCNPVATIPIKNVQETQAQTVTPYYISL